MADAKATDIRPATPWGKDVEILDGLNLIDKAELVGKPFLIKEVWFETGTRGIEYVYANAEFASGEEFSFNDSSSGIRSQIEQYLKVKKVDPEVGQTVPLRLVIPNGLRVSNYEVFDERNRPKMTKTYYLTTSGKKAN
jgi:hypothetical protein